MTPERSPWEYASHIGSYLRILRYGLPPVLAMGCLLVAARSGAVVGFILIIVAFGLIFEVGTAALERATRAGGMQDYRQ